MDNVEDYAEYWHRYGKKVFDYFFTHSYNNIKRRTRGGTCCAVVAALLSEDLST